MIPLREKLDPYIRHVGLNETARRCQAAGRTEVTQSRLSAWLNQSVTRTGQRLADLSITSLETICQVLGLRIIVVAIRDYRKIPRARSGPPVRKKARQSARQSVPSALRTRLLASQAPADRP